MSGFHASHKMKSIIFSCLIQEILDGTKTQTRRMVKFPPSVCRDWDIKSAHDAYGAAMSMSESGVFGFLVAGDMGYADVKCPYGKPGDILYVKETWKPDPAWGQSGVPTKQLHHGDNILYKATLDVAHPKYALGKWRSALSMPEWAARIKIQITDARAEKLQDISDDDARAEGVKPPNFTGDILVKYNTVMAAQNTTHYKTGYKLIWNGINAPNDVCDHENKPWKWTPSGAGCGWSKNPWVWCISFKFFAI